MIGSDAEVVLSCLAQAVHAGPELDDVEVELEKLRLAELLLEKQRERGSAVVGVELTEESVRLGDLPAARRRTVMVLGHEQTGIPAEALDLLGLTVEIPMVGTGSSLNVAVAGSLVLYRLAGLT